MTGAEAGAEIKLRKVRDIGREALHQRLVQPEFLVEAGDHLRVGGTLAVSEEACGEGAGHDAEDNEDEHRHDDDRGYDLQGAAQGEAKHEPFRFGRPNGRDNRGGGQRPPPPPPQAYWREAGALSSIQISS